MKRSYNILIVGAGQIGSRHLQGLAKCRDNIDIHLLDPNVIALRSAEDRWNEVFSESKYNKLVRFYTKLDNLPKEIDLVIHATRANGRIQSIASICRHISVRAWILEKILVQSSSELDQLITLFENESTVWVNLPRRGLKWHASIRDNISHRRPLHLNVSGKVWGLACNSVHYLDMLSWFSGESLMQISTDKLSKDWIEAKRHGNLEIMGELIAQFSGGSTATLSVEWGESTDLCYEFELQDGDFSWRIDEENSVAIRSDGLSIPGRLPYQSEVTPLLVDRILSTGQCELPTLAVSAEIHRVFLDAMLSHFRKTVDPAATCVPIT